jgi:hypothetical protein
MKLSKDGTLIILDWDDTLFPTSWVVKNNIDLTNKSKREKYIVYFKNLDDRLFNLLFVLKKCGIVIIVTNAMPEWVSASSSVLINTHNLLRTIKVISARKMYQTISKSSMEWKKRAFNDELSNMLREQNVNHIISVGDAEYEYRALISLYKNDPKNYKLLKSIKLMKDPTHDILIDQIEVLKRVVPRICIKTTHMDLEFKNQKN